MNLASFKALQRATKKRIARVLTCIFSPVTLPIQSGPLKGKKWIATSGIRFIRGNYEAFKTEAYLKTIQPGDVVFDVGANVGYYAAIASQLAGQAGRVIAFEPRPMLIGFFRRHMRINRFQNVELIPAAVGDRTGEVRFETRCGFGTGHISAEGGVTVKLVSLDELYAQGRLPCPNFIKIDVEGAENLVLEGAKEIIGSRRPVILVATHGDDSYKFCHEFLTQRGYALQDLNEGAYKGDREILATALTSPNPLLAKERE